MPMQETRVWSLAQEDPLDEEAATHSSTLVWRITWTEESGTLQSMGLQRLGHNSATEHTQTVLDTMDFSTGLGVLVLDERGHRRCLLFVCKIFSQSPNYFLSHRFNAGPPRWLRRPNVCLQCRRPGFNPWVGKIPWRRKWQPTAVFLVGESYG